MNPCFVDQITSHYRAISQHPHQIISRPGFPLLKISRYRIRYHVTLCSKDGNERGICGRQLLQSLRDLKGIMALSDGAGTS